MDCCNKWYRQQLKEFFITLHKIDSNITMSPQNQPTQSPTKKILDIIKIAAFPVLLTLVGTIGYRLVNLVEDMNLRLTRVELLVTIDRGEIDRLRGKSTSMPQILSTPQPPYRQSLVFMPLFSAVMPEKVYVRTEPIDEINN